MKFPQGFISLSRAGGYWDRFINGDDSFHNIINVLDFPLESVEEDKGVTENWESQFQSPGPFNSDISQGLPPVFNSDIAEDAHDNFVQNNSDRKQLPVTEISSTHVPLDSSHSRNPSLFQTPSSNYVVESSSSCSAEKNMSTYPELLVPVKTRTKIPRSSTFSRWHLLSLSSSPKKISKSKGKKKMKKLSLLPNESKLSGNCYHQHMPSKRCVHCQAVKTPQWRDGPMGPKTLCNACGVRYRSGRLLPEYRPAVSPTFVPSLHSNIHKKVIKMREKPVLKFIKSENDPAMPTPPETVPASSEMFGSLTALFFIYS